MADGRRVRRRVIETEKGTPQGAFSPLLANIYLHYVYDQWAHRWRQRCATGDVIVERYADDPSLKSAGKKQSNSLPSSLVLG
jgi:retron-type reverse transcriptase